MKREPKTFLETIKELNKSVRLLFTEMLLRYAFDICPDGYKKLVLAQSLKNYHKYTYIGTNDKIQKAGYIISFATATYRGLDILRPLTDYPCLTDKECMQLAKEHPYSFTEIRNTFHVEGK